MEGTLIADRYRVDALIGEGGVARVYRGTDETLDRRVAIKILRPELSGNEDVVARFRREAHAAAKLNHPNIVQIYDTGVDNGHYYIVMEYLPELNLKEIIKRYAPLPLEKVIEVGEACCEALAYAHRRGLVHRDVKPHNVLFTDDGHAKLSDFGIAAATGEVGLTDDGKVLGSAHYISPEQAQGAPAGPLSDIYSLGVTLYEALTGRLPFDGETAADIAAQHLRETPPSPREVNPEIPPAAEFVITKAMARDPQRRYRSAEEMAADIRKLRGGADLDQTGVMRPSADATMPLPRSAEPARPREPEGLEAPPAAPTRPVVSQRREEPSGSAVNTVLTGIGTGLLALLVIFGVVWLARSVFYPGPTPTMVDVPNVKGLTEQEAREQIEERRLVVGRIEQQYDDRQPAGRVVDQTPGPGQMVQAGSTVDLTVNLRRETVSVVDATGMTVDRAAATLEAADLTLGEVTELFHEEQPAGIVFDQDPAPGTRVDMGTSVDLFVSRGPEEDQPEEPADGEQQPDEDGTVEDGEEEPATAPPPQVFIEENANYRPDDPAQRLFEVRVVAQGEQPDQQIEIRWRDASGATLREPLGPMQPGESKTYEIVAQGTVTIEVHHQDQLVREWTFQVPETADQAE